LVGIFRPLYVSSLFHIKRTMFSDTQFPWLSQIPHRMSISVDGIFSREREEGKKVKGHFSSRPPEPTSSHVSCWLQTYEMQE